MFLPLALSIKQFVNAKVAQQDFLPRDILFLGADADVADFHFFSPFPISINMVNYRQE